MSSSQELWRTFREKPWLSVFVCALLLRLGFLAIMLSQMDSSAVLQLCSDADVYYRTGAIIRETWDFSTPGTTLFGPGYPFFLALAQWLTGGSTVLLMVLHAILSSLGSALIYVWANNLVGNKSVALAAGLLNAFSFTSISLANILLSETLFFVLTLVGFIVFLRAHATGKKSLYVVAGFGLAAAAYVRVMGEFLFVLLPFLTWLFLSDRSGRLKRIAWTLVTAAVMIVLMGLWAQQFYRKHGVCTMALSGPGGLGHVVRVTYAAVEHTTGTRARAWTDSLVAARDSILHDYPRAFNEVTMECLSRYLKEHPGRLTYAYLRNISENMHNEYGLQDVQFPKWAPGFNKTWSFLTEKKLNYRVTLLAVIGCAFLLIERRYRLLLALLMVYGYFAAMAGCSMWQTSRIFYPGEIAWTILVAFPLVRLFNFFRGKFSRH